MIFFALALLALAVLFGLSRIRTRRRLTAVEAEAASTLDSIAKLFPSLGAAIDAAQAQPKVETLAAAKLGLRQARDQLAASTARWRFSRTHTELSRQVLAKLDAASGMAVQMEATIDAMARRLGCTEAVERAVAQSAR